MSYTTLFNRIRRRCQREGWYGPALLGPAWLEIAASDPRRAGFEYPKATLEQLQTTEGMLGFALPAILASLYTLVANGGFGPGCGIRGTMDGYPWYEQTIVEAYQSSRLSQLVDLVGRWVNWPQTLLPLCDLGCDQEVCLDCQMGQVIIVAPTEHARGIVPLMKVASPSLEQWLDNWLSCA